MKGVLSSMTRTTHSVSLLCDVVDDELAPTWKTLSVTGMAPKSPDMTSPSTGFDQFTHMYDPWLIDHLRYVSLSTHSGDTCSVWMPAFTFDMSKSIGTHGSKFEGCSSMQNSNPNTAAFTLELVGIAVLSLLYLTIAVMLLGPAPLGMQYCSNPLRSQ